MEKTIKRLKKNDPIEVIWLDVIQNPAWQEEADAARALPSLCRSLGYYLNHTSKLLRISESLNRDLTQRSVQTFPIGVVLKINKLKGSK